MRIATGLAGTPMVPFDSKVMTDRERWSLVHYIQSLRRKDIEINDILAPPDGIIHAARRKGANPRRSNGPLWESHRSGAHPAQPALAGKEHDLCGGRPGSS